jgi:hypothetical protein
MVAFPQQAHHRPVTPKGPNSPLVSPTLAAKLKGGKRNQG